MPIYSGSIYNNILKDNIIQYIDLSKINNIYSVYNIPAYISGSNPKVNITIIYNLNGLYKFNGIQTTQLETVNGQSIILSGSLSQTIYYQRVYSSGLNDWSYYKTVGSIDSNPSPNNTIPPYSGSILSHEIVGILKQ